MPKYRPRRAVPNPAARWPLVSAVAVVALLLGSALGANTLGAEAEPTPQPCTTATPSGSPTPSPSPSTASKVTTKAVVIVIENHPLSAIKSGMPKTYAYGQAYAHGTNLKALTHPSQPNYIGLSTGAAGKSGNTIKTLSQPDIWNGTLAAGRTMKVYVDGLPSNYTAKRKDNEPYAARHVFTVPFVATATKKANFNRFTVSTTQLGGGGEHDVPDGTLPNVGAIIPNNKHNAHSASLSAADAYISGQIKLLMSGPDWDNGLTIIVTADEDDKKHGNVIPAIVLQKSLSHKTVTTPLDLYSVGGFLADLGHTPRLGNQKTAGDFAKAFGLVVR